MYTSVKSEDLDPWTNNVSEGGNNAINIAAAESPTQRPKIIPFIKTIQQLNAEHETGKAKKAWTAPISSVSFNLIPEEKSYEG